MTDLVACYYEHEHKVPIVRFRGQRGMRSYYPTPSSIRRVSNAVNNLVWHEGWELRTFTAHCIGWVAQRREP